MRRRVSVGWGEGVRRSGGVKVKTRTPLRMWGITHAKPTSKHIEIKCADLSACGVLNSILLDSKSEVKRSEERSEAQAK